MSLSLSPADRVFGPALAPNATYAECLAYREALGLPGPVDRWLTANVRSNRIAFLRDYLMLVDANGADCVEVCVRSSCVKVSTVQLRPFHRLTGISLSDSK